MMQEDKIEAVIPAVKACPEGFQTDYFMVYGTLRLGGNNYNWALKDTADYIETKRVPGFVYAGSLSAYYSGDPEDAITIDVFKIKPEFKDDYNRRIDRLEGGYDFKLVALTLSDGTNIEAKFYESVWKRSKSATGDYLMDSKQLEKALSYAKTKDNGNKFIEFYNQTV